MSLTFRKATPDDEEMLQLWDQQPHVIAASGSEDTWDWQEELAKEVPWQEFLIFEQRSQPVGIVQIIDPALEETHYWGEVGSNLRAIDIWIGMAEDLGRGYGTEMMRQALDRCFEPPEIKSVLIDPLASNTRAIAFYERLGFELVEPRIFGTDECLVYVLHRARWSGK